MRGRHAADAEQRDGDRDLRALGQREDLALGARLHDAVAGENQRPLGGVDERQRLAVVAVARQRIVVRFHQVRLGAVPIELGLAPAARPW